MQEFEKLGVFYLGRPYDLAKKRRKPGWLLYDSKDLVTHAVCVGMTGSGKTGLCLGLLEEAAIDGIPALVIDPKGDLGNLLLTFPDLRGEDFAPWINEEDARRKGLSPEEYARQQADLWRKGLAEWGQDGARIARLRAAADFAIYTPGSQAGLPVSILKAFAPPPPAILAQPDLLREQVGTTVTSLLGLVGLSADPIKSPPHILLSKILEAAWKAGESLDLVSLIQRIQAPPFTCVGALDLDAYYPAKERFELAVRLNNLIAAPGFEAWLEGEPLDIDALLHTPAGKPRLAIFSIAHLSDAERMFFVSLLLNETVGWMRRQSGTTSLRAIVYMDEIVGYFPPVANPPTKGPLLTLLKQARAFGVGVVLATQNPVDLDYKGLANAGTWFIGRLQTERDKARVLDGLEGAAAGTGQPFDRRRMEQLLAGLGNRVFLLNNVHEAAPEVFETRWTLSYLRGPLTRTQIQALMETRKASGLRREASAARREAAPLTPHASSLTSTRPVLPPEVPQHFLPIRSVPPAGARLVYRPMVLGVAQVRFLDAKAKVDVTREVVRLAAVGEGPVAVAWEHAVAVSLALSDLDRQPQEPATYAAVPAAAAKPKSYEAWGKDFASWLYRTQKLALLRSPTLGLLSMPEESERDFRIRLQQLAHERRDQQMEKLRQKYAPKRATLEERLRRARQQKEREAEQAREQYVQTALSVGATLLGALLGRKALSTSTVGRATTAARGVGRSIRQAKDVARAEENEEAILKQLAELDAQFQAEAEALATTSDPVAEVFEAVPIRPTKANIAVRLTALAWTPVWQGSDGSLAPGYE
ncbi:ATP-binding protein [Nitrospira sp. Kam-Ns4a]